MESNDQDQMNSNMDEGELPASLSPEYFALLHQTSTAASLGSKEKTANLLLASDIPDLLSTTATPSQAYQYLLSIPNDMNMEPFNFQDVLPNIILNIRCACENLATKARAKITQSGILLKLAKLSSGGDSHLQMISSLNVSSPSFDNKEDVTISSVDAGKTNNNSQSGDVHVEFLQICIMASQYHFARLHFRHFITFKSEEKIYTNQDEEPLESGDSSNVSQPKSSMNALPLIQNVETYLRYRYLRGIIYYALDEIYAAVQEWNLCLSTPAKGTSHIVVEAYKKLILAKALLFLQHADEKEKKAYKGDTIDTTEVDSTSQMDTSIVLGLPNGTSICVSRKLKSMTLGDLKIYNKIANIIEEGDESKLQKLVDSVSTNEDDENLENLNGENSNQYILEDNRGMAKRLIGMMKLKKLRNIAMVYEKIPLARLATKMGMSSVEECLKFLIQVGMKQCSIVSAQSSSECRVPIYSPVKFSIDEERQVVYFDDNDDDVPDKLEQGIGDCIELARRVKHLDMLMVSSKKYQAHVQKEKKHHTKGKEHV
jgi:hypothetical protein